MAKKEPTPAPVADIEEKRGRGRPIMDPEDKRVPMTLRFTPRVLRWFSETYGDKKWQREIDAMLVKYVDQQLAKAEKQKAAEKAKRAEARRARLAA